MSQSDAIAILRTDVLKELNKFIFSKNKTAGLCYLRGRRRVGKSTCLEQLRQKYPKNVFYFMGRVDEKGSKTISRCAKEWDQFTGAKLISRYKSNELDWDLFWKSIIDYGKKQTANFCLVFDEIQWIAKERIGFLGSLKEHWLELERIPKLKVILCGSSNKFFHQMTGGEEKLIRGLKTRSDIWLKPLSLAEIKKYYNPRFSTDELLLSYSFIGGIPYYWNQFDLSLHFIQAINKACFTSNSLFIEEYQELLNLEFQKNSIKTLELALEQIKGTGTTEATIAENGRLPTSTIGDLLVKLEDYKIVFGKTPLFSKPKEIQRGKLFYLKDFYLNFYFRILRKKRSKILKNKSDELLFSQILEGSKHNLFIQNYTGPMFELLVQDILENSTNRTEGIFRKLNLQNIEFEIGFHWDKDKQFDLILHNTTDRVYRLIECKWTHDKEQILNAINNFEVKTRSFNFEYQMVLCLNHKPNKSIVKQAETKRIKLIEPDDFF